MKIFKSRNSDTTLATPKLASALVESDTNPGEFYHVQIGCTCKSFLYTDKCKHVRTVVNG